MRDTTGVRPPDWVGAALGVLSLAVGLAAAELTTAAFVGDGSVVVDVGDQVVDRVPRVLREWAISTFGTADKSVLLVVMGVVLFAVASLVGILSVRGRRAEAIGVVVATVLLGSASALGRGGAGPGAAVATLAGGAAAVAVLLWLTRLASAAWSAGPATPSAGPATPSAGPATPSSGPTTPSSGPATVARPFSWVTAARASSTGTMTGPPVDEDGPHRHMGASRRRFLVISAGIAGVAAAGEAVAIWLRSNAAVAAERLGITLPDPARALVDPPSGVSVGLDGVTPFFTPNEHFYRIDTALSVPRVSVDDWSLRIHGLVERELTLDYRKLLERPMIELDATIACVSNYVGGDLIGNARWLGCRLDDLLEEAGIDPAADQVVGRSVDGFTAGFPTATLDGRDALVAVGMNGEPLPTAHGYPARLIVPGLYGYVSATKWLSELELTTFADFEGYWVPRGWDREAPVLTSSRFDTPTDGARIDPGEQFWVGGVAWAMTRGVESVEVRVDDGPWEPATLGEEYSGTTWRQWRHDLELSAGEHTLAVRATDTDGVTQSGERRPPGPNASTGWHTITVSAAT